MSRPTCTRVSLCVCLSVCLCVSQVVTVYKSPLCSLYRWARSSSRRSCRAVNYNLHVALIAVVAYVHYRHRHECTINSVKSSQPADAMISSVRSTDANNFPRNSSNKTRTDIDGGTGFLILEPLKQLPTSLSQFISFESSSVTLKLPDFVLSVFNIYRTPLSSRSSKPLSVFLDEFNSFLSTTATTPHEFLITGDFNIHLDNPTDYYTSQFLSLLSSFNLTQHVNFPTHNKKSHPRPSNYLLWLFPCTLSLYDLLYTIRSLPHFHYTFRWPYTSSSSHFSFFSSPSLHWHWLLHFWHSIF